MRFNMKKPLIITAVAVLVAVGVVINVYKPEELNAASTNQHRINLKDGRVTSNDNGFGRFNEQNSGPFGKATTDDIFCYQNFPG